MRAAEELAGSIVRRYLNLMRYRRYRRHQIRKQFNIPGRQLAVLRHLVQAGPRSVGQISRFLYVRDATTSPLLERMERAGFVTRRRCREDSRKVLVEATDLGREVVSRAHGPHRADALPPAGAAHSGACRHGRGAEEVV